MSEKERWMRCPYCPPEATFESTLIHNVTNHIFKCHLDKIDTDYDKETGAWSYWRCLNEL